MKKNRNDKGQTLIAIVVLMVLALSVGIVVSNRFVKSLKTFSESDNASRALAVADAAVERMLLLPNSSLQNYINFNNCGSDCTLVINGVFGQKVQADVTLSYAGASADPFEVKAKDGEITQVSLSGYPTNGTVDLCWNTMASIYTSYIYEQSSVVKSTIYAYNPLGYSGFSNGFSNASSAHGYLNCFTVSTIGTPKVIRVKIFNADTSVFAVPSGGATIPSQGIIITSTGRAGNAVRVVKVLRSTAAAPEFLDFVIYQKSLTEPLSNRPN